LEKIKNPQKKMFRKDTTSRGHQRELARKGRHRSQLRVPTCGGMSMSTDGPQPTQGAPKKKKKKRKVGRLFFGFWDCFFVPCFLFLFFWRPLVNALSAVQIYFVFSELLSGGPARQYLHWEVLGGF
jgi:hypothetical protein